jgi:cellulose synthase/poly-beta-1,6-N-acetylglucosamine synthase-like glycosyltransferase
MSIPELWVWILRLWLIQAWAVALLWMWRVADTAQGLPKVPDLLDPKYSDAPLTGPSLTVVVPALNEEAHVAACLQSLLAQEYQPMRIVAVNDRSTDGTGAVMDALAASHPDRLRVLHVTELPPGWLGKTHAMALAARESATGFGPGQGSEFLLFTDADVVFRPDALRRTMAFVVASGADHMVTVPTLVLKSWDETALLSFFQVCAMWAARPWRVADPKAKRDAVGVGAFNLLRRSAYEQVGGFEALRLEIVEDLGMARRIKRAGLAQRIAFGRNLVRVHWAPGAMGVVEVLTKNMFSAFGFRIPLLLGACGWLVAFCVLPALGVLASLWLRALLLPGLVTLIEVLVAYRAIGRQSRIPAWYAALSPFAAMLLIYTLLRSMVKTLQQGGVVWRGTFYSLAELRRHAAPLW